MFQQDVKRVLAEPNYCMVMLGLTWFETQIHRIAKGKAPDENLSACRTVFETLLASGMSAFMQRRA